MANVPSLTLALAPTDFSEPKLFFIGFSVRQLLATFYVEPILFFFIVIQFSYSILNFKQHETLNGFVYSYFAEV